MLQQNKKTLLLVSVCAHLSQIQSNRKLSHKGCGMLSKHVKQMQITMAIVGLKIQ